MNKNYTHISMVIDRSGSMSTGWTDVVGGYKSIVKDNKALDGKCTFTVAAFDDKYDVLEDFTNIKDVIALTSLLATELSTHESGFHDVVNVGGGNSVSMINMIQVLESLLGKTLDLEKYRQDPNDVNYTNADSTYLSSLVGQVPSIDLMSGLEEVLKWASGIKELDLLRVWAESVK